MRIKENADDYRYFPDPDLPPVGLEKSFIDDIKSSVPMLPFEYEKKWMNEYNLSLNENVSNKFKPGNLIRFILLSRLGYGGPEITSTLCPILLKLYEISFTYTP